MIYSDSVDLTDTKYFIHSSINYNVQDDMGLLEFETFFVGNTNY